MKHVFNWIIYCIWIMVFVLACKASFSLLLDHADEILQKSFVVGTTTSIETSSYISETLQLLNLETVQIWMRWQNFTSQLMEQRNHYRRKNKWLQQWDLPDTQPNDSRNEWKKTSSAGETFNELDYGCDFCTLFTKFHDLHWKVYSHVSLFFLYLIVNADARHIWLLSINCLQKYSFCILIKCSINKLF